MKNFRDLQVWSKAHELALVIYKETANFPREEIYGLTSQMRRASASIAANIAEGCGRGGDADFARYLQIAMGSASELEYHALLARDLSFISDRVYEKIVPRISEVKRMLARLIGRIRQPSAVSGQHSAKTKTAGGATT